jgi:hypothetical protein
MVTTESWYDNSMRLSSWQYIVTSSASAIVDAFDVRTDALTVRPASGHTAKAWWSAGAYIREALGNHGSNQSQSYTKSR